MPEQTTIYVKCKHCDHFVEENDTGGDSSLAQYIHLDNGEKEHSHDAEPGVAMELTKWQNERPDLFVTHLDDAIGPNSEFHVHPGTYDYLTNGTCEDVCRVSEDKLRGLGLKWGMYEDGFYPLTKEENQYIKDGFDGKDRMPVLAGYSVLMGGKKYFAPTIENEFRSDSNQHDQDLATDAECMRRTMATFRRAMDVVEPIGGRVRLEAYDGPGESRHTIILMIPMEHVLLQYPKPKDYFKWLSSFFG